MGLIPRETQNNINQALKCLYSIDKSLGRIAEALEKQNEIYRVLEPVDECFEDHNEQIPKVRTAEWYDDHNE